MSDQHLYRIIFFNQGQFYELYARQVAQGGLYGFVEVEEPVFGERTQLVVDPGEERLKKEFEGVERFYVPMHSVVRIDQVKKRGTSRISSPEEGGKVAAFPVPLWAPKDSGKS